MNAAAKPFTGDAQWRQANAVYLALHRERLRKRLERRVLWLRARWNLAPPDEWPAAPLDALAIRDATVDRLLQPPDPPAEQAFYEEDPAARKAAAELGQIEERLEVLSRQMAEAGAPAALDVLSTAFGLNPFERDVLLLCAATEMDPAFSRLYAYVQDDASLRHVTVPLAVSLFCVSEAEQHQARAAFLPEAALRRYRLTSTEGSSALGVDGRILDYLHGINRLDERIADLLRPVPLLPSAPGHCALAAEIESWLRRPGKRRRWQGVNLYGTPGSGRSALARLLCDRLGLRLFRLDPARLPPPGLQRQDLLGLLSREAVLSQLAVWIDVSESESAEPDSSRPTLSPSLTDLIERMPVFFLVASRARLPVERELLAVAMPRLDPADRQGLWQKAFEAIGARFNGSLGPILEQFDFPPELVTRAVATAQFRAGLRDGDVAPAVTAGELWEACREQTAWQLSHLARRILSAYEWDDIVLPDEILRQLREIAAQVIERAKVYYEWGFGRKLTRGRGISALFAGASGTGKTMAAEILANHLRLDLYRVDLAGVVSKYIGETEKNLRKIFDAAEHSGSILFFDEADALFGRRTDVKDSHDRFANIEVNYLLQRMEDYRGLSILASNRKTELDRAFLRRLRFLVDFPFPDASQRLLIWQKVFPPETPLGELNFEALSRMEVAGGNIRNIALAAAFLAAGQAVPVSMDHLLHAARREYAKIDKMVSEAEFYRPQARPARR